jgi:hypothetical protein
MAAKRSRQTEAAPKHDSLTEVLAALGRLRQDAQDTNNAVLLARCDAAGQILAGQNSCVVCGEEIKPGMVRASSPEGLRHVPGALVCRKGGAP